MFMSVTELLEQLRQLSRAEKFQAMQILITELAKDEEVSALSNDTAYRAWSPYDYGDAAQKLMSLLEEEKENAES